MDFNFDTGTINDGIQIIDPTVLPPLGGQAGVLTIAGTGAIQIPAGTTGQEPSPAAAAMFRYNTDTNTLEYYNGTVWQTLSYSSGSVSSFQTSLSGLTPSVTTTGAIVLAGTLGVASGGTGVTTLTPNGILFGAGTSPVSVTSAGTQYQVLTAGVAGLPSFGSINLASSATVGSSVLPLGNGGTNSNLSGSNGSIIYNNGTSLVNSSVGTLGQVLTSSGAGSPTWTTASSTVTTNQIVQGDGTGAFTTNGATFVGSPSFSGVTLEGTVTNATDAVTKAYVDGLSNGLSWKQAVQVGTSTVLPAVIYDNGTAGVGSTLTDTSSGTVLVIDGYTVLLNDRVLVKNQVATLQNGIYYLSTLGVAGVTPFVLTRTIDANTGADLAGAAVFVEDGTVNATTSWVQQTFPPITVGTSPITWVQFSGQGTYSAGAGLTLSGNAFSANTDGVTTYINGSSQIAIDSSNISSQVLLSAGASGTTASWGSVPLSNTNAVSGTLAVTNGGTGFASYTIGDMLYANTTTSLTKLGIGSTNQALVVAAGIPIWENIVNSVAGTTNQISVTSSTGNVTFSLPSAVTTASLTLTGLTANSFLYSGTAGLLTTTAAPTNGQLLIGSTGAAPVAATISTSGSGISVTNGAGIITLSNTGVTSNIAGTGISVSGSTGAVTITNTGVLSVALNDNSTLPIYTVSPTTASTGVVSETITLNTQTANTVFAGPVTGAVTQPTFRTLVYNDVVGTGLALQLYAEDTSTPTTPLTTGANSVAIGSGSAASGINTYANGDGTNASIWGSKAFANGDFATAGDAQHGLYILRNITTDATLTDLYLDGVAATQRLVLGNNSCWTFNILITARRTDAAGGGAGYKFEGAIRKDITSGSTTFIGTPSKTVLGETNAPWDVTLTANAVSGDLRVSVIGEAAKTIRWVAVVSTSEVTN